MREYIVSREHLVVKDNILIQKARYNLTPTQQKLIAYVISKIKPTDKELQRYEIMVADFCDVCGIDKTYFYTEFKELIDDLDSRSFWIDNENELSKIHWFSEATYYKKQGKVSLLLNSKIKQYLLELSDKYTKYELYNILALKSKYSIRLYELFKSYEFKHEKKFAIEELKQLLYINYKSFGDIKKRVIENSIAEINTYTDITVSYTTEVQGRGNKVVSVTFYIKKKHRLDSQAAYFATIEKINERNNQIPGQLSFFM